VCIAVCVSLPLFLSDKLIHCNTLQHTATRCNTLQHTATHCNARQRTVLHCNTLQRNAAHCNTCYTNKGDTKGRSERGILDTLQHTAAHCNTLQRTAMHGNALQRTATHCNTLQHTATRTGEIPRAEVSGESLTHCNTLQHTATHCNTNRGDTKGKKIPRSLRLGAWRRQLWARCHVTHSYIYVCVMTPFIRVT